jgi:hypothetical protein
MPSIQKTQHALVRVWLAVSVMHLATQLARLQVLAYALKWILYCLFWIIHLVDQTLRDACDIALLQLGLLAVAMQYTRYHSL